MSVYKNLWSHTYAYRCKCYSIQYMFCLDSKFPKSTFGKKQVIRIFNYRISLNTHSDQTGISRMYGKFVYEQVTVNSQSYNKKRIINNFYFLLKFFLKLDLGNLCSKSTICVYSIRIVFVVPTHIYIETSHPLCAVF